MRTRRSRYKSTVENNYSFYMIFQIFCDFKFFCEVGQETLDDAVHVLGCLTKGTARLAQIIGLLPGPKSEQDDSLYHQIQSILNYFL